MVTITRFGVSFDTKLLKRFDALIKEKGYANRSEALRDITREYVSREKKESTHGCISLIFDPRIKLYKSRIAGIENEYHCLIKQSTKRFKDHHTGIQIIEVEGRKERIKRFIDKLKNESGVSKITFQKLK